MFSQLSKIAMIDVNKQAIPPRVINDFIVFKVLNL